MFNKNEKGLLIVIRYAPLLFIITLSILATYFIGLSNKSHTLREIQKTTDLYIKFNNDEIQEEINKVYEYILAEEKNSINNLKLAIKQRVYEAHAIASKIYEDNKQSKSKKEILELIKTAIGSIIYNQGRGYFFIDDINGVKLLQPLNKELENKNMLDFEDAKGYKFVQTIAQTVKNKTERFDTYYWYKSGNKDTAYKKMSFYKYFEPLDVAIGTGEYLDDSIEEMKQKIVKNIQNIKLNDDGYIFLLDYQGTILAHLNQDNIGKNFLNIKDKNNIQFVKEIIDIAKKGEGFISYFNSTLYKEPYKKTSFIKGYDKWNWIIGTGYDDKHLNQLIITAKEELINQNKKTNYMVLKISIVVTIILLIISILISRILEKIFLTYRDKIKEEEKEFRNLFEFSNIGLAISEDTGKFIKVNKKFTQMLGYNSSEELINKSWKNISHNDFIEEESTTYNELLEAKIDTYSIEKLFIKEDGSFFDAYVTANSFKIDNNVKYILSSIIDISEIKTKDGLLFQQTKMAAMGEMLANIAHQWRQPLSVISTAASGTKLNIEYGILKEADLILSLNMIQEASKYLSQTIDDFRNFFKPEKKKTTFDINHTIEQTLNLISAQFHNKQITIIKDIEPIEIKSFENELIQVLINILNNSRDALMKMKNEKFVFISTKKEQNNLIISIKDNAGGIPNDIIKKIFEPYFTTKHKSQGTGIGLYMTNEIIRKQIKGDIKVKNVNFRHEDKTFVGAEFEIVILLK